MKISEPLNAFFFCFSSSQFSHFSSTFRYRIRPANLCFSVEKTKVAYSRVWTVGLRVKSRFVHQDRPEFVIVRAGEEAVFLPPFTNGEAPGWTPPLSKIENFSGRLSAVTCKRAAVPRPFHLSIPSCLACFRSHQRTPFCLRQLITLHNHFKPQSPDIPRNSFEHTTQFPLIFLISRCMAFLKTPYLACLQGSLLDADC